MSVRIAIDPARCTGHGRCYLAAPSLLVDDDEGFGQVRAGLEDVPEALVADAEDGAAACPEHAIILTRTG